MCHSFILYKSEVYISSSVLSQCGDRHIIYAIERLLMKNDRTRIIFFAFFFLVFVHLLCVCVFLSVCMFVLNINISGFFSIYSFSLFFYFYFPFKSNFEFKYIFLFVFLLDFFLLFYNFKLFLWISWYSVEKNTKMYGLYISHIAMSEKC